MEFYESQARQFYRLLKHGDAYTQAHCHSTTTGKVVDRRLLNGEEEIIAWLKENNGKGNCFIGRNPRDKQGNVVECSSLSLDIDPVRPKGTAATDDQHKAALQAGRLLVRHFGYGVLCSSGNGALVLFPLREAVSKEQAEQWGKGIEEEARKHLNQAGLEGSVDVDSTWDAARLVKAMGAISAKGDSSLWRHARIIDSSLCNGESFLQALFSEAYSVRQRTPLFLPEIEKGDLDRSKADMALANRLKLQGFTAADCYKSLCEMGFRKGREDDYKRIIQKVYGAERTNVSSVVPGGDERQIILWTPESGMSEYLSRHANKEPELPTGFSIIDKATYGLIRGSIFTVGGRTNCGKTTFAVGVAYNLCRAGKRVLYVSSETTFQEVWDRYIAVATGVSAHAIQNQTTNGSTPLVTGFLEELKKHPLTIYDGSRPSTHVLRRVIDQVKPDVLVVDYFQHVEARDTKALEELTMDLHDMAKAGNFAVLMCAQLHDRYNPQTGKMYPPTLGDLKNSRVLADESRVVLLLDWNRDQATGDAATVVKVLMAKNKGSKTDLILKLNRAIPRFEENV